jgi:serine protease
VKKRYLIVGIALWFVLAFAHKGLADDEILERKLTRVGQKYVPGEIIVKFKPGAKEDAIVNLNLRHGASVFYDSQRAGFKRLRIPKKSTVSEMVEIYKKDPDVEYAEPNYIAYAFWVPNDQYYRYQWHMDNSTYGGISTEEAWQLTSGDSNVIVAVIDTGVAYEDYSQVVGGMTVSYYRAPDLAQTSFVPGYDFVNNDTHPNDDNGHGTHVTGTIAQSTNNGIGVAGVAFSCSVMPVKVLDKYGSGTYSDIAEGIIWAADQGAKVINLSLGGSASSATLESACAYTYNKGVTIVCAAGNDGQPAISYPAAYDAYCIAVGATRFDETRTYYSNYGNSLDIVAPGGDLNVDQNGDGYADGVLQQTFGSTTNDWGYWFYEGTSMAAPHVSGVAALLLSYMVASTPDEVRLALQSTAEDHGLTGWDSEYGWGLVDAYAALNYSIIPNNPPVANANGPYAGTEDISIAFDGSASYDQDGDTLTYSWNFGDGNTGTGATPTHAYTAGGIYAVTLVVNDGKANSEPSTTTAEIAEVNDPPVANAGPDQSALTGKTATFDGSASYDPDGSITSYNWDFGDGSTGSGNIVTHVYAAAQIYAVTLTVTDNGGLQDADTASVTVSEAPTEIEVLSDSFEISEWNGLWTEDSQNDWFRSTQRAVSGRYSAEVDGLASNARLISIPIDLKGRTSATITFSWYIESGLDTGEYLAFDISTNGGASWVEKARLRGNVDSENKWHNANINLTNINSLRIRFRGKMSDATEDANVDMVKVVAK